MRKFVSGVKSRSLFLSPSFFLLGEGVNKSEPVNLEYFQGKTAEKSPKWIYLHSR